MFDWTPLGVVLAFNFLLFFSSVTARGRMGNGLWGQGIGVTARSLDLHVISASGLFV